MNANLSPSERAKALKKQAINNSFALAGRLVDCYYTQGDALGYGLLGFQPVSTVQVEIISVLCRRLKYFL